MLKDYPRLVGLMILGVTLIVFTGVYYQANYKQDSLNLTLTETVRVSAIANADNSSRLNEGEFFINKESFEEYLKDRIKKNSNVNLSNDVNYKFEYLDNENGSTKAIRVIVRNNDVDYQATAIVDISNL
ncbi:hypothetical protein DES36_11911 [Alkalibaculum bacchi]|uniref:Uncharacterized protein n=1 Tax=Alkalibaculum bacchi TaxID=645887 RepID=A0A366HYT9_9FIRM|nr:hypothetical protein [Alkalibaculum bacchi]RBP59286.1 hypothetical protein DES36_11911 [Alkalibaculum bacchi]